MSNINNPYEGVELLETFSSSQFERYCLEKLSSVEKHISFITELVKSSKLPKKMDVVEIGSGNGKLLFKLYMEGLLGRATGYEISNSRTDFANRFKDFLNIKDAGIDLICGDFLEAELPVGSADLIIGIDVVINLIGPSSNNALDALFSKADLILNANGILILEFMTCERELFFIENSSQNVYKPWKQFADSDPYIFGLDRLTM